MLTPRTAPAAKVVPASPLLAVVGTSHSVQLSPRGEIGRPEMRALWGRALALAERGWPALTLDLRRVTHWDYRCLPDLQRLSVRLRRAGGGLSLVSPNRYLATILRFGGMEELVAETRLHGTLSRREEAEA